MPPMEGSPPRVDPRSRRRLLTFIQLGMSLSILTFAGLGWLLERTANFAPAPLPPPAGDYLKWALLAAAIVLFPLLRGRRRALHEQPSGDHGARLDKVFRAYVVFFALSEVPAVFGWVLFLTGQPLRILLLTCGLSLFYLAAMTPPADLERGAPSF